MEELARHILAALTETGPDAKCALSADLPALWQAAGRPALAAPPAAAAGIPGRPARPQRVPPQAVPRRDLRTPEGRAALIHALAHIEFNAINLALDAAWRFRGLPRDFYGDWLQVAADEARHFQLLRTHLRSLGFDYGDFPAHDGLWQMAEKTAHDPLVRMALVPRLMEARGLDVTPGLRMRLLGAGDEKAAALLEIIERDEIGHVAIGNRWYTHLCSARGLDPLATFLRLLEDYQAPRPKPPLHHHARRAAGFSEQELALWEAPHAPSCGPHGKAV